MGKFFGIFKNGQKKCPKFERPNILPKKASLCDHILKLTSGYQKNNFKIVSIIFFLFFVKIY
jgi:hypothetical protein